MTSRSRLGSGGYGVRRRGTFSGKSLDVGIVVDAFLSSQIPVSTGIKKPGIPSGTPEWLKTTLEILEGRRGNAIEAPPLQTLTFSATPTQEECEALYTYVNTVQDGLKQLLNRFDS